MARIGIYMITSPTDKRYIGSSKDISHRWSCYRGLHCKDQPAIYNSLKKYGVEVHRFSVLLECNEKDLFKREQLYFDIYQPELNSSKIAGRVTWTQEMRDNLSKKRTGMRLAPYPEYAKRAKSIKVSGYKNIQQFDKNSNLIAEYKSIFDAGKETGVYRGNIARVISGKRKTSGGYVWKGTKV